MIGQQDVAQLVNIASNANEPATVMQWDDPYDQNSTAVLVTPPLYADSGTITSTTTTVTFPVPVALDTTTLYQLDGNAVAGSGVDVTVTLLDPSGNTVFSQDNTVDEQIRFYAPVAGSGYKIVIGRFSTTVGAFTIKLSTTNGFTGATLSTNINLLAFTSTGVYVPGSSLTANNFATNEPIQLGTTLRSGGSQLQYVIARSNVPLGQGPTRIRYQLPGDGLAGLGPAEYFSYNSTTTGGHPTAAGANGMAAYSVLRPSLPEPYTSPGPARIYFDVNSNRLPTPEIRQQPTLAAADGAANAVSGFNPFSGTSAAGPHAAAIAALVLQAHGGHHSMTPAQMTNLLKRSTYPHDLDPSHASGVARSTTGGTIAIDINSDNQSNAGSGSKDTNAFNVTYTGGASGSSITSLVFNPGGTAATAGNVSDGVNAFTFVGAAGTYNATSTPGLVFSNAAGSYVVSTASTVLAANALATFTNVGGSSSQLFTMTLTFSGGTFTTGKVLKYTVNRLELKGSSGAAKADYWADLFGGGVLIPEGTVVNDGMAYSGTTSDGGTFSGTIKNHIGAGFSPLDGYGFINAETAVSQTVQ
ncbi:hypothetical protein ELE36_10955 [Pseudolysobacter antarcticus]|uniref:Peptidase S8/S53 domain-containing protein n=1 Tax=Pseudolysobacter antarcticus TaxID=2511995 RepID=A0A411HK25_9GAMM|nr:S8 family serine peptidase [Pseudolysobacter antarcticus]QBB70831.1 hypothetical protein ELE36_10955 [Pseudolysobacter antarcticus]